MATKVNSDRVPEPDAGSPVGRRPALAIAGVAIGLSFWLLVNARLGDGSLLWDDLRNFGHLLVFGLLAASLYGLFRSFTSRKKSYVYTLAACLVMGIATEFAQSFQPWRPFSGADIARDMTGAAIALGLICMNSLPDTRRMTRKALLLFCIAATLLAGVPLLQWLAAYSYRATSFPELAGFDTALDEKFMWQRGARFSIAELPGLPGSVATQVTFASGTPWPRLAIATESDWRNYQYLVIEIHLPALPSADDTSVLSVHVRDKNPRGKSHKWERRFPLVTGSNILRLDLGQIARQSPGLDMGAISRLMFYGEQSTSDLVIFLVSARLERSSPSAK